MISQKRIQLILNVIAYSAVFGYVMWVTIVWWQNPEWSQMQLLQRTWQGLVIMLLFTLPKIAYEVYRLWKD